jgi:hypothetical protein
MPPGPERDAQEIEAALLRCAGITSASGHVEETAALLERIDPILERACDSKANALAEGLRSANARSLGDFDTALACADRVAGIDGMARVATCWRLGVASLAGELQTAVTLSPSDDALADAPYLIEYARLCGRDPEVDHLGLTAFASFLLGHRGHSSNVSVRTMLLLLSSRIFARCGRLVDAEQSARDGLGYCATTDERHMVPELERQLGEILEARGQERAAREARLRALDAARGQGNVVSELRTLADLIASGEVDSGDRARLAGLRDRVGSLVCPSDRALLDRLSAGSTPASGGSPA